MIIEEVLTDWNCAQGHVLDKPKLFNYDPILEATEPLGFSPPEDWNLAAFVLGPVPMV